MATLYGVKDLRFERLAKRDLLLVDKLLLSSADLYLESETSPVARAGVEWLIENELISPVDSISAATSDTLDVSTLELLSVSSAVLAATAVLLSSNRVDRRVAAKTLGPSIGTFLESLLRATAVYVEKTEYVRTVPMLGNAELLERQEFCRNAEEILQYLKGLPTTVRDLPLRSSEKLLGFEPDNLIGDVPVINYAVAHLSTYIARNHGTAPEDSPVLELVLKRIPLPDESVSWEQIRDFKLDERVQSDAVQLRRWMRKVADQKLDPIDINEELEYLINARKDHLRLHRMKSSVGFFETLLTTAGDVAEHVAAGKYGAAARSMFSMQRRQVALLEAESGAPGREVAYISKVEERLI